MWDKRFTFTAGLVELRRRASRAQPVGVVHADEEQEGTDAGEERRRSARDQQVRHDEHTHQEVGERPVRLCRLRRRHRALHT